MLKPSDYLADPRGTLVAVTHAELAAWQADIDRAAAQEARGDRLLGELRATQTVLEQVRSDLRDAYAREEALKTAQVVTENA